MRGFRMAALLSALLVSGGCRSSALQKDQDRFRATILDSYTNQIMDNLIRASNAMPIVQVDYTNITGTVTDAGSAGTSPSTTVTNDTQLTFASLAKLVQRFTERMVANTAAASFSASRQQQLSVTGVPVIDKPDVYRAYLDFLSKPNSLIRDCNPPPPELVHIVRKVGDAYFYVPVEYKREFFELTLKTTVMRGEPSAPPAYFKATVASATPLPAQPDSGLQSTQHELTLKLKSQVPNDSGTLKFSKDGKTAYVLQIAKRDGTAANAPSDTLDVAYSEKAIPLKPAALAAALQNTEVEILLVHARPTVAPTDEILKSIFTQVQLNRLDNLRLLTPR